MPPYSLCFKLGFGVWCRFPKFPCGGGLMGEIVITSVFSYLSFHWLLLARFGFLVVSAVVAGVLEASIWEEGGLRCCLGVYLYEWISGGR